jgi:hypothetical protein
MGVTHRDLKPEVRSFANVNVSPVLSLTRCLPISEYPGDQGGCTEDCRLRFSQDCRQPNLPEGMFANRS